MLRCSLAYLDHAAKTQAVTYALEAIIEEALLKDFQAQGVDVVTGWRRVDPTHPEIFSMLQSRGAFFCSWTKAGRKRKFLQLLTSFHPLYDSYYGSVSSEERRIWFLLENWHCGPTRDGLIRTGSSYA